MISVKLTEPEELPALYKIFKDPMIAWRLCADPTMITAKNLGQFLLKTEPGTASRSYTIYHEGKVAGVITLNNICRQRNSAFIGVIAVSPGTKIRAGLKAARFIVELAFKHLNLNRLYGHTWADEPRMDAFYKRFGATLEGVEREHCWKNGAYVDLKIWGLLRREYDGN